MVNWWLKYKSRKHEAIKEQIGELQTERGLMVIDKTISPYRITETDKKIKALQKKLRE